MPWPEDHHHQIDEDPFVAAAWPTVQVGPLDQKASINRMLQAWRRLTGGQLLIVAVRSFGFVTAEVAVGTEAPTLLNELVSMKAQLASSPPVQVQVILPLNSPQKIESISRCNKRYSIMTLFKH